MAKATVAELARALEQVRIQMAEITARLRALENGHSTSASPEDHAEALPLAAAASEEKAAAPAPQETAITEEEMLAISAAIGAFLGVRAHIRQIRLLSSPAWAQQGRVNIQASHRL